MRKLPGLRSALVGGASVLALVHPAAAKVFDIPDGDLAAALGSYAQQSGVQIFFVEDAVRGHKSHGAKGDYTETAALKEVLQGSGFMAQSVPSSNFISIVPQPAPVRLAQTGKPVALPPPQQTGLETVVVTAQKKTENIQTVPIAVTALSQQQLTERQISGGPDLVKEVPNLTFSKTNFSGYNLEIRGIGTQAISVTTDPAVAVAFNSIPFIRNHFFEQEFYDLSDVEVLRGPQGTLYGRNATAGVVNIESARPTDQFEAMLSADVGNYENRRFEGMINLPIVGDTLDLRIAGEWTKRDGYTDDTTLGTQVDGRDLWSGRVTLGWKPSSDVQTYLTWEHFSESDDRLRSSKQLCKTDPGPTTFIAANGTVVPVLPAQGSTFTVTSASFSQGCEDTSLYSPQAFEVPNGFSLPFVSGAAYLGLLNTNIDPYASTTQSTNLRDIQSAILPHYIARNDTLEYSVDWQISPAFAFTSQTGFNNDFLWSTEDYNRFDTSPGVFIPNSDNGAVSSTGVFCDPQLGCSNRLVLQDLSTEHAWQFSQEFRLASDFSGPLNFSAGANYLHYETVEDYYVFSNTFTMISLDNVCEGPGGLGAPRPPLSENWECLTTGKQYRPPQMGGGVATESPQYIDPNPLAAVNGDGHNYFLSENPYVLNSYAIFGESYYDVTNDLKLTAGLRFTDDQKHFIDIPSELVSFGYGYPSTGAVDQKWDQFTGRFVANWSPQLDFTDSSMFYASYAHGYKAGGANPPGPVLISADVVPGGANGNVSINDGFPDHPLTFKPEFIEAFELGTKNSLLGDTLTLNADAFYYNYTGYQISEIVDRTAINLNFNANVEGAELETNWEPLPGLKFSFAGGFETSSLAGGSEAIDLMDRTAGMPGWVVMKPSVGQASNCIFPTYVAAAIVQGYSYNFEGNGGVASCGAAYFGDLDPVTHLPYALDPKACGNNGACDNSGIPVGYPGFNPATAPNDGEGFDKNLSGNQLPNAPHFTTSFTAEYTVPISQGWAATLHGDFYMQTQQWARVFEDPIDKIHGYSTTNVSLILTSDAGWQVMGYVKNVFDVTAITGTFLNSDDSGLTTNVFLTDPRLYGIRVTKQLDGGGWPTGGVSFIPDIFSDADDGKPPVWVEFGGQFAQLSDSQTAYQPPFTALMPPSLPTAASAERMPATDFEYDAKLSFQPDESDWVVAAAIRFGRASNNRHLHASAPPTQKTSISLFGRSFSCKTAFPPTVPAYGDCKAADTHKFIDDQSHESEKNLIMDFTVGKDVGLGTFGDGGTSKIGGGVRIAQFDSRGSTDLNGIPVYNFHQSAFAKYHDVYNATEAEKRSFKGIGPELTWDASQPVEAMSDTTTLEFDWGMNAGALFGRQRASLHHAETEIIHPGIGSVFVPANPAVVYAHPSKFVNRSRNVTVPNLGAYAGVSMVYRNAKVSFGYRADEFFGAMDGGTDTYKSYNRGFFGPFASISIGLGG